MTDHPPSSRPNVPIKALLLDLDNTLLRNDMEDFVPAYLGALAEFMADHFPPDTLIAHLMQATRAMMNDTDPSRTNMEAFDAVFFPALGRTRRELAPLFERFYATRFPQLRSLTRPDPVARPLVEWAFAQGFQVAIATNPLFPRTAIEQRLEWAGVPPSEFPYHLITSYEDMHATKPHTAYYLEIARRLGRAPEECLMVGDEWELDILPALRIGMEAYWISDADERQETGDREPLGVGSLADFYDWVRRLPPPPT
ncbi:MAG TPA: HAD family hydrolase [Chloroflexi bacterium]|nr:HAD family hydrolase [Chloroflexota bacterium]